MNYPFIIISAFIAVYTTFAYESFLPAMHKMNQSVHRWKIPITIGFSNLPSYNNLPQSVIDSFNAGTIGTDITIKSLKSIIPTDFYGKPINERYFIKVNKTDFKKYSNATINYNDIISTNNNVNNEAIITPEVIPNIRKVVKSETAAETEKVHHNVQYTCNKNVIILAAAIAAIYVKFFRPKNSSESLKSTSTEEKKPLDLQQNTQETHSQIATTTNENSHDENCFKPKSSALSLKEAPATHPSGFVEPELPSVHLSDHASSIGLVDGSQYSKHFQPGEVDIYKVAKEFTALFNPANLEVEVTTDSTEVPEEKSNDAQAEPATTAIENNTNSIEPLEETSNEHAEPAITASVEPLEETPSHTTNSEPVNDAVEMPEEKPIHATHSEPADLVVEVKADSIEPVERRRHSQSSLSDESTNFTDENSSETNVDVEDAKPKGVEKARKQRKNYDEVTIYITPPRAPGAKANFLSYCKLGREQKTIPIYHKKRITTIENSKRFIMINNASLEDFKNGNIVENIEKHLKKLNDSIIPWKSLEKYQPGEIDEMQRRLHRKIRNFKDEDFAYELLSDEDRFSSITQAIPKLCNEVNTAMDWFNAMKETPYYEHTSPQAKFEADKKVLNDILTDVNHEEHNLNWKHYYRYDDILWALPLLD